MENTLRKHITLPKATYDFLEAYQEKQGLANFSATVEAAVEALRQQTLVAEYKQFAEDYAASPDMRREAESWLSLPLEPETP